MKSLTERIAGLSLEKRKLLEQRLGIEKAQVGDAARTQTIPPRSERETPPPLSFAQQRIWFLDELEPNSAAYNISNAVRLLGPLDVAALEQSFQALVSRHEVLRTTFAVAEGRPVQVISESAHHDLPMTDMRKLSTAEQQIEVSWRIRDESSRPFDLTHSPLLRTALLRLADDEHILLLTMHHIISDGWSMGVLVKEIAALYPAIASGTGPAEAAAALERLPIQYADYAEWQREWLRGEVLERQLSYWKQQLQGAAPVLELPADKVRPAVQSFKGASESLELEAELSLALKELSRREGVTLFMTLLAVFKVLLWRYSGQADISIGTPVAGRTQLETEGLIGFFVNTLVLRTEVSGGERFRELLQRVREVALGGYSHQEVPFEKLVEELQPERELSRSPLFQVMFVLQNTPREELQMGELRVQALAVASETANFDLSLVVEERATGLQLGLEYRSELFSAESMQRMLEHYRVLLAAAVVQPECLVQDLPLMSNAERSQVVEEWNRTTAEYPNELCIHELIEAQVDWTPDAIAVICQNEHLTYRELNRRSNRLAHYLRSLGVTPEVRVGVLLERSLEMVVAQLAILKSGGAFLPLDPAYPQQRLSFLLEDAQPLALVTKRSLITGLPNVSAKLVCLDVDKDVIRAQQDTTPRSEVMTDNLAYVIHTSGSTGQPKGVMIQHGSLVNYLMAMNGLYKVRADDRILQFSSIVFDSSVEEIYMALTLGATLVLRDEEMLGSASLFLQKCDSRRITILDLPTAYWHVLAADMYDEHLSAPPSLRIVEVGGEKALAQRLAQWHAQVSGDVGLWNSYGPTEAAVASTIAELPAVTYEADKMRDVPIGKPLPNVQNYVLDSSMRPVPIGVAGELHIGGVGVGRGYLKQPALTAERFIPHPFSAVAGARLYRTGDLARYRSDGQLEYIGRVDGQVKVRGYRIELGEIEAALSGHPLVHGVAVIAQESAPGESRIVAYIVSNSNETLTAGPLRDHLKTTLPEYMIPSAFVLLEFLPLTATGKIDRKALPAGEQVLLELNEGAVQASSPVEEMLAGVWAEVLKLERVGVSDNFFELGGHSLLATQLISRVREIFHLDLPLRHLFELPTVAQLAQRIEEVQLRKDGLQAPPIQAMPRRTNPPLSFAQQRLWFLHQLDPGSHAYTLPSAVRLNGRLDVNALAESFNEIMRRHEILRTTFGLREGQPVQIIARAQYLPLPLLDLSEWSEKEREARQLIADAATHIFDLSHGPLIRAKLLRLSEDEHVLLLTMHHIVSDAWSTGIFIQEAARLYAAISSGAGAATTLESLPIQYADYAVWQREWLTDAVLDQQLSYWKQRLQGAPILALPTDKPRPLRQSFAGAREKFSLSPDLSERIREVSRREGATLFMTLLAAFSVLLSRLSGQSDITIGTPVAGRTRTETESLIGYFINALVLRSDLSGDPTFKQLLKQVRETALGAYTHQEVPFEKLVEVLHPERQTNHAPLFQVVFNFQNAAASVPTFPDLTFSNIEIESNTTKYDLTLYMWDSPDELTGAFAYQTDLFEASTILRFIRSFEALLTNIVVEPGARVSTLETLSEEDKQQLIAVNQNRAESNRKRLASIKRKAVKLSPDSLIETSYLQPEATLPLVIRPAADNVDLIDWGKHHRQFIETELLKHGAILFRGFNVTDVPMFERFARTVTSSLVNYVEGSSARISMGDQLYTSTEYPPELFISLHNELSYAHKWPGKIFFFCLQVPSQGGETPIADSRKVFSLLDPKTKEVFIQKEVKYLRNLNSETGAGLSWQSVFETTDRTFVEEYCRQGGIEFSWKDDGTLRTAQVRPAVATHPATGEMVWFNQVDQWHPSNLGTEAARAMLAVIKEDDLPINARYGDDSPLEEATLDEIREVFRQVTVSFPWQQGDVMLLDNMLVAHGRYPFSGPRRIVVAMGDTVSLPDYSKNGELAG